jgi:hypothetical protein
MNAVPNWKPLQAAVSSSPDPYEAHIIARAQSILTMNGKVGPVLSYPQALDVVRWAEPQLMTA